MFSTLLQVGFKFDFIYFRYMCSFIFFWSKKEERRDNPKEADEGSTTQEELVEKAYYSDQNDYLLVLFFEIKGG